VLAAFVGWEHRSAHPMLKLGFFSDRRFSVALAAECLGLFGLLGGLFVSTQFLEFDLGYSPLGAGLRILPIAVILAVSAALSRSSPGPGGPGSPFSPVSPPSPAACGKFRPSPR
jgi:hypothetical protein